MYRKVYTYAENFLYLNVHIRVISQLSEKANCAVN